MVKKEVWKKFQLVSKVVSPTIIFAFENYSNNSLLPFEITSVFASNLSYELKMFFAFLVNYSQLSVLSGFLNISFKTLTFKIDQNMPVCNLVSKTGFILSNNTFKLEK